MSKIAPFIAMSLVATISFAKQQTQEAQPLLPKLELEKVEEKSLEQTVLQILSKDKKDNQEFENNEEPIRLAGDWGFEGRAESFPKLLEVTNYTLASHCDLDHIIKNQTSCNLEKICNSQQYKQKVARYFQDKNIQAWIQSTDFQKAKLSHLSEKCIDQAYSNFISGK